MPVEQIIPSFFPKEFPYNQQLVQLPGSGTPGATPVYRNAIFPELVRPQPGESALTILEVFLSGMATGADRPCLGWRPRISSNPIKFANKYEWLSYADVNERRLNLGSAIEALFRSGRAGGGELPTVGIWCQNRPEWQIIDQALHTHKKIGVSLYDTLGHDAVEYIINHAEITIAFVAEQQLPAMLALTNKCPKLKVIVSIDDPSPPARRVAAAWAKQRKVELLFMTEMEEQSKENRIEPTLPGPDDIATICYTSGTTNVPKGALLSHYNLVSAAIAFLKGLGLRDGTAISYLPLAHIYERVIESMVLYAGCAIGYFTGDPLRLLEDIQILKPSLFPSVPRVLNRIALGVQAAMAQPGLKGALLSKGVQVKLKNLRETGSVTHPFWDRVVFKKTRALLGGNVTDITTGSAPINKDTLELANVIFCVSVIEGWGMTENCAAGSRTLPNDRSSSGTVGTAQPCSELKLVDVPQMGYTSRDKPFPRGELCTRGANTFKGYYKDVKNTKEALDEEGWLHSGDVAELDDHSRVRIIDRVKNIMKLSQGEYVALERLENAYSACPIVQQIYVHGDSLQDHLIGILVPEPPTLVALAERVLGKDNPRVKHIAIDPGNPAVLNLSPEVRRRLQELVAEPKVATAIQDMLNTYGKKLQLRGFEFVKRVYISFDPFTVENNMLTPTLKLRRRDVYSAYKPILSRMYEEDKATKVHKPTKL